MERTVTVSEPALQLALFEPNSPLERAFEDYHRANPQVYELFKQFTFEVIRSGRRHFSADAVLHRIRWEAAVKTTDSEGFKINNNYAAFYARKFMKDFPQYEGFFRTRRRRS